MVYRAKAKAYYGRAAARGRAYVSSYRTVRKTGNTATAIRSGALLAGVALGYLKGSPGQQLIPYQDPLMIALASIDAIPGVSRYVPYEARNVGKGYLLAKLATAYMGGGDAGCSNMKGGLNFC